MSVSDAQTSLERARVSVVIPTHNGGELLMRCVHSVMAQQHAPVVELLIVDDSSTDDTVDLVHGAYPAIQIVAHQSNRGPGATRNLGWRSAGGEIIAFLDHDVTVAVEWLESALRYFDDPAIGGVEGRTEVGNPERITPFTHWTKNLEGGQYPFCNMVVRRALLEDIGGFDERFYDARRKVHFREDIELVFRAQDRGWQFRYAPDAIAYHPPLPSTARRPLKLAQRYYFDPLLRRLHPRRFHEAVEVHRIGPVSLRRPRHFAAFCNVGVTLAYLSARGSLRRRIRPIVGPLFLLSYLFPLAAATRHNKLSAVPKRELATACAVFLIVPWVYVWAYMRGIAAFRQIEPADIWRAERGHDEHAKRETSIQGQQ